MSGPFNFPDQTHVEQIRKHLWSGREFGQAAVMVGAGFSRNAEPVVPGLPPFPLWRDLAEKMYDSLYPPGSGTSIAREMHKARATSGAGMLKLASEYEIVFGRTALDDFLVTSVPDTRYTPRQLHELLLSLPWSDVFTTNYDTLLERTLPAIHERKYDVIPTTLDIPGKMRPRIVKLHGSFPSYRPFIITEEDYRRYPRDLAPFVNIVQQSLMENVFCLVGFSGDDTNFLYWSGWVRDNLGDATPYIYLCGLLDLSGPQRRLLENRRIIPVDLSSLFPQSDWPDRAIRHSKAAEWFLLNLLSGEPPTMTRWPIPSPKARLKPSDGLPPIPPGPSPLSDPGEYSPTSSVLQAKELVSLRETWMRNRLEYPGWVVAPKQNRNALWFHTEHWVVPVLDSMHQLSAPEDILLLYELNWRLEKSLVPLSTDWVEKIAPIVKAYNAYPTLIGLEGATITPDKHDYEHIDWENLAGCWVELLFALAREARESLDENRFALWMNRLQSIVVQRAEWQARWHYEQTLFRLFRLDQEGVRASLRQWPVEPSLPFWASRKASVLAELGELEDAERVAEQALAQIRLRLQPYSADYVLLSQEGWTMLLLTALKTTKSGTKSDFAGQYRDRWERLEAYRCNPWADIEAWELTLSGRRPVPRPVSETLRSFDPGRMTVTRRIFGEGRADLVPAFSFLRMLEEAGLPPRGGRVNIFSDAVAHAAEWIKPFAPQWSISCLIRAGEDAEIEAWFDRVYVATLDETEVGRLNAWFTDAVTQAIRHLNTNPAQIREPSSFSGRQIQLLPELISRLCFRFSASELEQLFSLAVSIYKLPLFRSDLILYKCPNTLFERLLPAMPLRMTLDRMAELISLPIPGEAGFDLANPDLWKEPLNRLEWEKGSKLPVDFDRSSWSAPVANLIRIVRDDAEQARASAVWRLAKLCQIQGLSADETRSFAQSLWSRISPVTRLPSETDLVESSFLFLPQPTAGIAKEGFRAYVLRQDFPRRIQRGTTEDGHPTKSVAQGWTPALVTSLVHGSLRPWADKDQAGDLVDWSPDEAVQLLGKVITWWDDQKSFVPRASGPFKEELDTMVSSLVEIISTVILPKLASADGTVKTRVDRLLSEMEQARFSVLSIAPMTLFVWPERSEEIARKTRETLNSVQPTEVREALTSVFYWLAYAHDDGIPNPPPDLLAELINRLVTRRQPGLELVIHYLSVVVAKMPSLLNHEQISLLCRGLEYLIGESRLPTTEEREGTREPTAPIPFDDRPEYRASASRLAYHLLNYFGNANQAPPMVLLRWKEIGQTDPLPEVRRIWETLG